jgi:NAD(P)H-hydrate epimerase
MRGPERPRCAERTYNPLMTTRLTRRQVREVDRRAIAEFHIPGIVLMENAARAAADAVLRLIEKHKTIPEALIVCGGGNNGGDGFAAARHLHNAGVDVRIAIAGEPDRLAGDAATNFNLIAAMKLPVFDARPALPPMGHCIIVDALFGTGLDRAPAEPFVSIIEQINRSGRPVIAIDVPSGLDCDTGRPPGACVRANHTITFVAEKVGFGEPQAKEFLGEISVGDIGCPRELVEQIAGAPLG